MRKGIMSASASASALGEKIYANMLSDLKSCSKLVRAKLKKAAKSESDEGYLGFSKKVRGVSVALASDDAFRSDNSVRGLELAKGVRISMVVDSIDVADLVNLKKYVLMMAVLSRLNDNEEAELKAVTDAFRAVQERRSYRTGTADEPLDQETMALLDQLAKCYNVIDDPNTLEAMFANTKIGGLAREIAEDIDVGSLNLSKPEDLLDIGKLLSPNSPIGNIIGTVGTKIQQKIQSGDLNQMDLMAEAMNLLKVVDTSKFLTPELMSAFSAAATNVNKTK
jgi:hypothetical protein